MPLIVRELLCGSVRYNDLQRGVPTVLPISWNRQTSTQSCAAAAARMPGGTYSAQVIDGALRSNQVTFSIS